jgi:hypothetical protein
VTVREPEFSERDRALLLAYKARKRDIGLYGESLSEAMSPDSDPSNNDATIRYEAVGPAVNHAEQVLERAKERFYEQHPDAPRHGHKWTVRKADQSS